MQRTEATLRYAIGFVAALVVAVLASAIAIWSGAYNFAASEPHSPLVRWSIDTALHRSVAERAAGLTAPASPGPAELRAGARDFMEYCVHCHGAPGVRRHQWASGMRPDPTDLSEAAAEWSTEEVFWIAKHGIRMSGMPAFGDSESDEEIWRIAAFVKRLPGLSPAEYARLQSELLGRGGGEHEH